MKAVATLVLLLGLTACSSGGSEDDRASDDRDTATSSPGAPSLVLSDTEVCGLVREGIDAFNVGDLGDTIAAFEEAVEPAEELAREQPSDDTEALLEAVRYYAALPADDYVEANQSSPEFARHKDFTLTECAYDTPPGDATEPAVPA